MSKFSALKLPSETPQKMFISHPITGADIINKKTNEPAFIELLSTDSKAAQEFDREATDKRLTRKTKPTAVEFEAEILNKMVKLTKSWSMTDLEGTPLEEADGSPVACTPANVLEAYRENPWLLEQVNDFARNRANFLKT